MVAFVIGWLTNVVATVNVPWVWPAGTVTDFGTVTALKLLDSETIRPPAGAGEPKMTVPVEGSPP